MKSWWHILWVTLCISLLDTDILGEVDILANDMLKEKMLKYQV